MTEKIYAKSDNEILKYFIGEELKRNHLDARADIPVIVRKKLIFTCIFSLITLALISTFFFHFRRSIWLLEIVNIVLYIFFMKRFNTMTYLIKEVRSRPDEEISYIVYSLLSDSAAQKKARAVRWAVIALGVLLPVLIFLQPHMLFEHGDEGCYVRFYTRGVIQPTEVTVPAQHKGEDVVGIRGNVFANLQGVDAIILPDTIDVIRGYAFADSRDLETVVMPQTLSYLGGNAFQNCELLWDITLPQGLTEIRGSTFESCTSLETIDIPEGVTRIGGHAFNHCVFLENVTFPSTLEEIGSSAFRDCWFLKQAILPQGVSVNERAFKDSDTELIFR